GPRLLRGLDIGVRIADHRVGQPPPRVLRRLVPRRLPAGAGAGRGPTRGGSAPVARRGWRPALRGPQPRAGHVRVRTGRGPAGRGAGGTTTRATSGAVAGRCPTGRSVVTASSPSSPTTGPGRRPCGGRCGTTTRTTPSATPCGSTCRRRPA